MKKKIKLSQSILLPAAFVVFACDGGGSGVATVKGALSPDEGANVPVEAVHVGANGEVEVISQGTTDAQGRYEVSVSLSDEGLSNVAIRATTNGRSRSTLVTGVLVDGDSVTVATMDDETSAEVDLFISAHENGAEISDVFVREMVDARLGAALAADGAALAGAGRAMARGFEVYADSWRIRAIDVAAEAVAEARAAEADAMRAHDEALAAAADAEARAQIAADLARASAAAYTGASITLAENALAIQPAMDVLIAGAASIGAAGDDLIAAAELRRAWALTVAAEAELAAAGASADAQASLQNAGVTLRTALETGRESGELTDAEIQAAWENYERALDQALQVTLPQAAFQALVQASVALDNAAVALENAQNAINNAIGAVNAAANVTGEFGNFYDVALSDAQIATLEAAGIVSANARGLLSIRAALEVALR